MTNGSRNDVPTTKPDDLGWQLSYDRASVDRFLAEVEVERDRLHAEIRASREGIEARASAAAAREREGLEAIGALAIAARDELTRIEAEHQAIIASIRDAAAIESARVLAAAHREADAMRASTESLAGIVVADKPTEPTGGPGARGQLDAG